MRKKLLISFVFLSGAFFYCPLVHAQPAATQKNTANKATPAQALQYKIIPAKNNTWGYDILKENKIFIHQPTRPGMPGLEGFATKTDAEKVARLVMNKMQKGEMPPTVTPDELKRLQLTN